MGQGKNKKAVILASVSILLSLGMWMLYTGFYQRFPFFSDRTVTVGVFSDSYWEVPNGYSYQILEDAIQAFEESHLGVRVEYVSGIMKEDYSEWLAGQLLSGQAPDLFFVLSEDFNDLAEVGALKDLAPLIEKDSGFEEGRFYSSAYRDGQYRGIQYSLPFECAPKLMFVNKSILAGEGLSIPEEDWNWEEFYEICRKVTRDTDGNGTVDQFGVVGYGWEEAFESNGIQLFDQQGKECRLADTKAEASLMFLERLQGLNQGYNATAKDFDLGNVAFQPMSFSEYRAYKPYPLSIKKYSSFEWGCIPMPSGPKGSNISALETLRVAMNAEARHTGDAWELMKTLTCDERIQSEIFMYSEGMSVLKEVTESEKTLQQLIENSVDNRSLNLEILSSAVEHAAVAPRFRNYDEAMAEVDKAVNDILEGETNVRMGQIIWNRRINKFLE